MYLDSSVAVKLYVSEQDSADCETVVSGEPLAASELLRGELYSALLNKERIQEITAAQRQGIWALVEEHISEQRLHLVPLTGDTMRKTTEIMETVFPVMLRTLDAIHLATYLSVDAGPLFTRDKRMVAAAKKLGIPLAGAA